MKQTIMILAILSLYGCGNAVLDAAEEMAKECAGVVSVTVHKSWFNSGWSSTCHDVDTSDL